MGEKKKVSWADALEEYTPDFLKPDTAEDTARKSRILGLMKGENLAKGVDEHQSVLSPYQPTTRESVGGWMAGDKPDGARGRLAKFLMGSSGLGAGTGVVDFVPGVGTGLQAQEGYREGGLKGVAESIFVGMKGAKNLGKLPELEVAKGLHKQGFPINDIQRETGWSLGPRGADDWQYEISDHDMKFKPGAFVADSQNAAQPWTVGETNFHPHFKKTVDHPEFLQAYPEANDLRLMANANAFRPPGGSFDAQGHRIDVTGMDKDEVRQILAHELQHAADSFEKKAGGSSPKWTRGVIETQVLKELPPEEQAIYHALSEKEKNAIAYRRYRHDAGEVNAEITRNRLDLTPEQRLEREPMLDRPKDIDPDLITLGRASAGYAGPVKAEMAMPDRTFSPGKGMDEYERVDADVRKLDADLAKDRENYVGQGGAGGIGQRYENFGQWLKDNPDTPVEMPRMGIDGFDRPSFGNGRHRFAHFRDSGATELPVMVNKEQAQAFRDRYGAAALAEALDRAGE